jgi:hypothetical protein
MKRSSLKRTARGLRQAPEVYRRLSLVLVWAAEYLTVKEAMRLLALNSYLKEHLVTSSWRREIVLGQLRTVLTQEVHEDNYSQLLLTEFGITANRFEEAYEKLRSTVNLIANPFGAEGFSHWTQTVSGGNGWAIETDGTYLTKPTVFVSSYEWCELTQDVPVKVTTPLTACLSSWIARRHDCGAVGQLKAEFTSASRKRQFKTDETPCSEERTSGLANAWTRLSLTFEVPRGAKRIRVTLRGKDTKWWRGHYGCRFGMSSLTLS